ncbi:MAG: Plasmid recombination enzyme [Firmicutes bacterium ADurb.Bin182]|nr:MAG: Plasmid recombination enzyme [Firmicutes bacterium ADurb.Bin182]
MPERSHLNVHFKQCGTTYAQAFDSLVEEGTISTRGLKPDAKVIDEMIFDVNTAYFDRHGGYEYAREFFQHAYEMAVEEAGSEQYILSAVMHADERNRSLSDSLRRDVFHYHLHVVYIPVVEKEIKWSKRCKDVALVGTVREVIRQVSHSKKWKSERITDEHGNARLIPSYSLLQDRFFEHMKNAGYSNIERGEKHSAEVNLTVAAFKARQEQARAQDLERSNSLAERELKKLKTELSATIKTSSTIREIESMGSKTLFGKVELSPKEHSALTALAKEGLTSRVKISGLERQLNELNRRFCQLKDSYHELYANTREYFRAVKLAPQAVRDFFTQLFAREAQEREAKKQAQRGKTIERRKNRTGASHEEIL